MRRRLPKRLFGSSKSETADDRGWSLVHVHSLARNAEVVKVLLDAGFDPNLKSNHGATPLKLAHVLGWEKVAALLVARGVKRITSGKMKCGDSFGIGCSLVCSQSAQRSEKKPKSPSPCTTMPARRRARKS